MTDGYGSTTVMSNDATVYAVGDTRFNSGEGRVEIFEQGEVVGTFDGSSSDRALGWDLAMSGDGTLLAAAGPNFIRIYTTKLDATSTWSALNGQIERIGAFSGSGGALSVSNDGSTLVVGAPMLDSQTGAAFIYNITFDGSDNLLSTLDATLEGDQAQDLFGKSVAVSDDGNTVAVGARGVVGVNERGYVRTFRREAGSTWKPVGGNTLLFGERDGDRFGEAVSLSGDGARLSAGAWSVGNGRASYVKVYDLDNDTWSQVGSDLQGPRFGINAVLTPDGQFITIGDTSAGVIRVYQFSTCDVGDWSQVGDTIRGDIKGQQFGRTDIGIAPDGTLTVVGGGPGRNDKDIAGGVALYALVEP